MPRPKKEDKKPVAEKPKATTKRRKDKEEDHDDLEEFEEKPEKKLKVEGQNKGKAKICILVYLDQRNPGDTTTQVHSFKNLASALEFGRDLIEKFEGKRDEEEDEEDEDDEEDEEEDDEYDDEDYEGGSGNFYFNKNSNEYVYDGRCSDGGYSIRIKELTVDEFLKGEDLDIRLYGK